jgi:phage terminase large subunit GpA-like protein
MDAVTDASVEQVIVCSSAQVGKTEVLLNLIGFHMHQDPAPMLLLQPTLEMGQAFSKDRLRPMLRDTAVLRGLVKDPRSRDSGNTLLQKTFPGGHLTIAGANSPASLASRPIRVVLLDEVDRYPASAGSEGDPVSLAHKRAANFYNRKLVAVSTPTVAGTSRIEALYQRSDQRQYYVPCPDCGHAQTLRWPQVRWENDDPNTAEYVCESCGSRWDDATRWAAIRNGYWQAGDTFNGIAGFHLNELMSPWRRLSDTAGEFLAAKDRPEQLQTWVNTALGETWQEQGDAPDWQRLYERREFYEGVPSGGLLLTAGVDIQPDRLEVSVWAWGRDHESWLIEHRILGGDPTDQSVWTGLDDLLVERWPHQDGGSLGLNALAVDEGYQMTMVDAWVRRSADQRVIAVKGMPSWDFIIGTPKKKDVTVTGRKRRRSSQTWPVGTYAVKAETYRLLRLVAPTEESGEPYPPGFVHLPRSIDDEFCKQLCAEEQVRRRVRGYQKIEWQKVRDRNEALDCRVYARAAAAFLGIDRYGEHHWQRLKHELEQAQRAPKRSDTPTPPQGGVTNSSRKRSRSSFVGGRAGGWVR